MSDMPLTDALEAVKAVLDQHKAMNALASALGDASNLEARIAAMKAEEIALSAKISTHQKSAAETEARYIGTVEHYRGLTEEMVSEHQKTVDEAARQAGQAHTRTQAEITRLASDLEQAKSAHSAALEYMATERKVAADELRRVQDELAAFKSKLQGV